MAKMLQNQCSRSQLECTKIAHRHSLAIFTADEGIAGNSAARIIFTRFYRRKNRGSLAIFFAEEIAHLGASKSRAIFLGAVKSPPQPQRIARFWCTQAPRLSAYECGLPFCVRLWGWLTKLFEHPQGQEGMFPFAWCKKTPHPCARSADPKHESL